MAYSKVVGPTAQGAVQNNTIAINMGSGPNRYLLVWVTATGGLAFPTTVTYAGTALTTIATLSTNEMRLYGLRNPASGSNNLVVNYSTDPDAAEGAVIGWVGLDGIHQGASDTAGVRTSGTNIDYDSTWSIVLSGLTAGDYCVSAGFDWTDYAHTPTDDTVERVDGIQDVVTGFYMGDFEATGTSATLGWTDCLYGAGIAVAMIPAVQGPINVSNAGSTSTSGAKGGKGAPAASNAHTASTLGKKGGKGSASVSNGHTTSLIGAPGAPAFSGAISASNGHTTSLAGKKAVNGSLSASNGHTTSVPGQKKASGSLTASHAHTTNLTGSTSGTARSGAIAVSLPSILTGTAWTTEGTEGTFVFGGAGSNHRSAQVIQIDHTGRTVSVALKLKTSGSPTDSVRVSLHEDGTTAPGAELGFGTLPAASLTAFFANFTIDISAPVTAGTKYWLVVGRTGAYSDTNRYGLRARLETTGTYPHGKQWFQSVPGGGWTANARDVSPFTVLVDGVKVLGTKKTSGAITVSHGHKVQTGAHVQHGQTVSVLGIKGGVGNLPASHGHTTNLVGKRTASGAAFVNLVVSGPSVPGKKGGRGSLSVSHGHVLQIGAISVAHGHSVSLLGRKGASGASSVSGTGVASVVSSSTKSGTLSATNQSSPTVAGKKHTSGTIGPVVLTHQAYLYSAFTLAPANDPQLSPFDLGVVPYKRLDPPELPDSLPLYLSSELHQIEEAIRSLVEGTPQAANSAPLLPKRGWVRFAVAPWNPGSGVNRWYFYDGYLWKPLEERGTREGTAAISHGADYTVVGVKA